LTVVASLGLVDYAAPEAPALPLALSVARQMLDKGTCKHTMCPCLCGRQRDCVVSATGPVAMRMAKLAISYGAEMDKYTGAVPMSVARLTRVCVCLCVRMPLCVGGWAAERRAWRLSRRAMHR
jgi:enoyl-CoA hydratase/carnithine racemase